MSSAGALTSVNDALHHLTSLPPITRKDHVDQFRMRCDLMIGLRNLKALLHLRSDYMQSRGGSSIYSDIKDAALEVIRVRGDCFSDIIRKIHCLAKELDRRLGQFQSNSLTADEAVGIADTVLDNTVDFLRLANLEIVLSRHVHENLDALEVQITFLKNFLLYAVRIGVRKKQLYDLLVQVGHFPIGAARIFIKDDPYDGTIFVDVESKCSQLVIVDSYLYKAYSRALRTSTLYPTTQHEVGVLREFLDSLVSLLWCKWCLDSYSFDSRKNGLKVSLYGRLKSCRAILKHGSKYLDAEIINQIGVLICDAVILVFPRRPTDAEMSDLPQRFDAIRAQVESLESNASGFDFPRANDQLPFVDPANVPSISGGGEEEEEIQVHEGIGMSYRHHLGTAQAVGFKDDETASILNGLIRGSKHLRIVAIVGMAGLGKTTLALKLFNDPSVARHFHARARFSVSQLLDKRRVFLHLLNQLKPGDYSEMTENDLANKLRQSLKGRRYLIFLDDVWTSEAWDGLKTSFPDDSTQSRIILTSRQYSIAPAGILVDGEPYSLRLRENHECLEILQAKLFPEMRWPLQLEDFGMKIAEKCRGLPLTAVIIAGLLATMEHESWKEILNALSTGSLSIAEQCNSALELSYGHLPDDLKACLLYFGAFPEDDEVPVKRLIRLWMAEAFVRADEDVAREYLEKLIERSLVTVAQNRSIGGVKTCRIHDLLHDFCRAKAKQERFFDLLQGHDQLSASIIHTTSRGCAFTLIHYI